MESCILIGIFAASVGNFRVQNMYNLTMKKPEKNEDDNFFCSGIEIQKLSLNMKSDQNHGL